MAIIEGLLLLALVGVLVRLFRGPSPGDRLLAYNSASNRVFVLLAAVGALSDRPAFLSASVVYAALSFLGVVILARFTERGGGHR